MSAANMPLSAHLNELRKRIIICLISIGVLTVCCYINHQPIANFFIAPFQAIKNNGASINVNTIYEGFFMKIKLSFLAATIFSCPILLFQICRFILPGLKKNEKKWLFVIIFFSSFLSILSTYLGYKVIFPYIINFLLTSNFIPSNINILLNYQQNIRYIISFLLGGVLVFQSPILLMIMLAKNIVTRLFLWQNCRWFIVGIVITSAIVTPPDIFSQLTLSVPLIICYFACILIAKWMNWGVKCSE